MAYQAYSKAWRGPRGCFLTGVNDDGTVNAAVFLDPEADADLLNIVPPPAYMRVFTQPIAAIRGPFLSRDTDQEMRQHLDEYVLDDGFALPIPEPLRGDAFRKYWTEKMEARSRALKYLPDQAERPQPSH